MTEQKAILKALDEVVLADDRAYEEEASFVLQLAGIMGFKLELVREARKLDFDQAMETLKDMSLGKKQSLATMLRETAGSDGRISEEELELIQGIIAQLDMD